MVPSPDSPYSQLPEGSSPFGTTLDLSRACEEKTPWKRILCMRGMGIRAASFPRKSKGSKQIARVPSPQALFNPSRTFPSGSTFKRFWASGGRSKYLHIRSSPSLSSPSILCLACRSKP